MQSDIKELQQVLEGLLFIAGQGVEIREIAEKLEIKEKQVKDAIEKLKEKYQDTGINVITYKDKVQLCSNPKYADDIAEVLNPIKEKQLTKAALETMAIIAYKQPVTKSEIELVRGVDNADYAVQILLNFNLIEVVGRKDAVGKPLLYGTTDEFLKRFELQTIEDLPDYDELLERIKVINDDSDNGDSLFNFLEDKPHAVAGDEVPEFLKGEDLQTVEADDEAEEETETSDNADEVVSNE